MCKVFDRRRQLSEILSAFEFWDQQAHELVRKHLSHLKSPLTADGNAFFVLIETSGSSQEHDSEKLEQFLSGLMEDGLIVDGTVASDMTQFRDLWAIRESIPEACAKSGYMYKVGMITFCVHGKCKSYNLVRCVDSCTPIISAGGRYASQVNSFRC